MRCKNCKKTVENEKLLRCPHCGKPLPKKKQLDKKKIASISGFVFVTVCFFVFSFLGFFFKSAYYSSSVMIVGIILFAVCVPFVLGGFAGISKKHTEGFAAVMSLPFIVNWFSTFMFGVESVDYGGFCTVYYWFILAAVVASDMFLIFAIAGIIKNTKLFSYISLGLTVAIFGITIAYFVYANELVLIGILIVAFQNIMPTYMAFNTLNKDE